MMTSKSADAGDGDWPCANIVSTIARNAATQRKISFIIERRYRTPTLARKSMDTKRLCCPLSSADFWSVVFAENSACYKSWRIIGGRLAPRMDYKPAAHSTTWNAQGGLRECDWVQRELQHPPRSPGRGFAR